MRDSEDLWCGARQSQTSTATRNSKHPEMSLRRRISKKTSSFFSRSRTAVPSFSTETMKDNNTPSSSQSVRGSEPAAVSNTLPFISMLSYIQTLVEDGSSIADYESMRDAAGELTTNDTLVLVTPVKRNVALDKINEMSPDGCVTPAPNSIAPSLPPASTVSPRGHFDSRLQREPVAGLYMGFPRHLWQVQQKQLQQPQFTEYRDPNEGVVELSSLRWKPSVRASQGQTRLVSNDNGSELSSIHWKKSVVQLGAVRKRNDWSSGSELSSLHWAKSVGQLQAATQGAGLSGSRVSTQAQLFQNTNQDTQYNARIPLASTDRMPSTWPHSRLLSESEYLTAIGFVNREATPINLSFPLSPRNLISNGTELSSPFSESPLLPRFELKGPRRIRPAKPCITANLHDHMYDKSSSVDINPASHGLILDDDTLPATHTHIRSTSGSAETVVWKPAAEVLFSESESEADGTDDANAAFFLPRPAMPEKNPVAALVQEVEDTRDRLAVENKALKAALQGSLVQLREGSEAYEVLQARMQRAVDALQAQLAEIEYLWRDLGAEPRRE